MSDSILFDASLQPQVSNIRLPLDKYAYDWSVAWQKYTVKAPTEDSPRKRRKLSASHIQADEEIDTLFSAKQHVEELASITEPDVPSARFGIRCTSTLLHKEGDERSLWLFEILPSHASGLIGSEGLPGLQVTASGTFQHRTLFPGLVQPNGTCRVIQANKTPSLKDLTPGGRDAQLQAAFQHFIAAIRQTVIQNALQVPIPRQDVQRRACGDGIVFLSNQPDWTPIIYIPHVSIRFEGLVLTGVWHTCSYTFSQSLTETSTLRLCPIDIDAQYVRPFARVDYSFRWTDEPKKLGRPNTRKETAELPHLRFQFKQIYPSANDEELEEWVVCKMMLDGQKREVVWPKAYCLTSSPILESSNIVDPRSHARMSLQDLATATAETIEGMVKERDRAAKALAEETTDSPKQALPSTSKFSTSAPPSIRLPKPKEDHLMTWAQPRPPAPVPETRQATISAEPSISAPTNPQLPTQQSVATEPKAFDFGMDWMQDTTSADYWTFDDTFATKPVPTKGSKTNDYDMFDNMMGGMTEDDFNFFDDPSDNIPPNEPPSFAAAMPFETMTASSFPLGASPLTFPSPMYDYPTPQQPISTAPSNGLPLTAPSSHPTNSTDYPSVSPGYHNLFEASPANMQSPAKTPATPFTPSVDDFASPQYQSQPDQQSNVPPPSYAAGLALGSSERLHDQKGNMQNFAAVPFQDMASSDILSKYRLHAPDEVKKSKTKYPASWEKSRLKANGSKKRRHLVSCLPRNWKALDPVADCSYSEASSDEEVQTSKQPPRLEQSPEDEESPVVPSISIAMLGFSMPSQPKESGRASNHLRQTSIEAHYEHASLCKTPRQEVLPALSRLFASIQDKEATDSWPTEHLEPPKIKVCRAGSVLQADISLLSSWEKASLSPLYGPKNTTSFLLSTSADPLLPAWIYRLGAFYESAGLGNHAAIITEASTSSFVKILKPVTALNVRKALRQLDKDLQPNANANAIVYIPLHLLPPDQLDEAKRWLKSGSFDNFTIMVLPSTFTLDLICTPRLDEIRSLAFDVYDRLPAANQGEADSKMAKSPAYTLARQSSDWSLSFEAQWPPVSTDIRNRHRILHIAYSVSSDSKLLSIIATDDLCEGSQARIATVSGSQEQVATIWKFVREILDQSGVEWRICIGRLGVMDPSELSAWAKFKADTLKKDKQPYHISLVSIQTNIHVPIFPSCGLNARKITLPPVAVTSSLPYLLHAYYTHHASSPIPSHQDSTLHNTQTYDLAKAHVYSSSQDPSSTRLAYIVCMHLAFHSSTSTYTATMWQHIHDLVSSLGNLSYYSQARWSASSREPVLPWHLSRLAHMMAT